MIFSKIEYYFISHKEFEERIESGEFIEFTKFSNNYYGTRSVHSHYSQLSVSPLFLTFDLFNH